MKERNHRIALEFSLQNPSLYAVQEAVNVDCRERHLATVVPHTLVGEFSEGCLEPKPNSAVLIEMPTQEGGKVYGVLDTSGKVYFYRNEKYDFIATGLENATVEYYTDTGGETWAVIVGETGILLNAEGRKIYFSRSDLRGTACFFKHRLFVGAKGQTLLYSAPEDITNFEEPLSDGGEIVLANRGGEIEAVKACQGYLYVFFSHGIARLDIKGDPKEFVVETVEYNGEKIFARTVCACKEGIFFLAKDGVYRLSGKKTERVFSDFVKLPLEETGFEYSVALQDKVFLGYYTKDGVVTLVLYADGKSCYYAEELAALSKGINGTGLFADYAISVCRMEENGENILVGRLVVATDFGVSGYKTLRKLRFEGEGQFELVVRADKRKLKRKVVFVNGEAEIDISERGKNFSFSFLFLKKSVIRKWFAEFKTTV